jgi:hypothetical protein
MSEVDELYALVPADEVDTVVEDLERHGIFASEIEVRDAPAGRYPLRDERLHEETAGARHGAELGAAIGAVIGIALGLVVPFLRDTGVSGLLVATFGGGGFGALIGAMWGLQLHEMSDDDPARTVEVTAAEDVALLEVRCLHFHGRAHHVLEAYPGVTFLDTTAMASAGPVTAVGPDDG